jgi:hypothetical protein
MKTFSIAFYESYLSTEEGKRQAFLGLYEEGESVFFESFEEKWLLHKL